MRILIFFEEKIDLICPVKFQQMKKVGETLRELRTKRHLLLREVAAAIKIDPTLLSKIERDERLPTEEQLKALSKFFKVQENNLLLAYLSDRILIELKDQPLTLQALHLAEQKYQMSSDSKSK